MIVDYHTHTHLCKHAQGVPRDYVKQAITIGLDEIGCSEHIPMPDGFDSAHRMDLTEYNTIYAPQVTEVMEEFADHISIRRGIEADYFPGTEDWVRGFIRENDFDYVIGSVHFLGEWGFDNAVFVHQYEERNINDVYEKYYEAVARSAASGLFDIIAHCDLVKKFGHRPTRPMKDAVGDALNAVRKHDLCIEINTSGLRKPVHEMYPEESILAMAGDLKIPITLGSDAHSPGDVGADFDRAIAMVERYAGGKIAAFDKRERKMVRVGRLKNTRTVSIDH